MKASELRSKTIEELQEEIESLLKEKFSYRMQRSTSQLGQTHLMKQVSRDLARAKTVLQEKLYEAAEEAGD